MAAFVATTASRSPLPDARPLSQTAIYVLTRAVANTIRSAAIENSRFRDTPDFEDELVRLVPGFPR